MKIQACNTCGGNCMGCFYSDECNNWNDIAPYNEAEIEVDIASMELCICGILTVKAVNIIVRR